MQRAMVNIYQVGVTFDASNKEIRFDGDMANREIGIPQGIHMIHFKLSTENGKDGLAASFPSYPIQWLNEEGGTNLQPQCYLGQWFAPDQCSLVVFNAAGFETRHVFNVVVAYDQKVYGSDPTIINEPPVG